MQEGHIRRPGRLVRRLEAGEEVILIKRDGRVGEGETRKTHAVKTVTVLDAPKGKRWFLVSVPLFFPVDGVTEYKESIMLDDYCRRWVYPGDLREGGL